MKKLILGLSLLAIAATITFVACKKDDSKNVRTEAKESVKNISRFGRPITAAEMALILEISDDPTFQALVLKRVNEYNNGVINANEIKNLLTTELTPTKLPTYVNLMGYSSVEEFVQVQNECKAYEDTLEIRYGVAAINGDIFAEAIDRLTTLPIIYTHPTSAKPSACETVYRSSINSIVANVTVMHCGCVALDMTVPIVGAICHSAAAGWAISQIELADAAYAACK